MNAFDEFVHNFHFLRPWWLLSLLTLPLIWRSLARATGVARAWSKAVDAHLLPHLLVGAQSSLGWPRTFACAALAVAAVALAGPAWERLPAPLYRNAAAHVIALELSQSMLAADVKPDRLSRARYKVRDLLQRLGDGQVALLAYAGDAFVVAPLTQDVNTVEALIDALDPGAMPVQGNATATAIERAVALIGQAGARGGDVLLIADSVSDDAEAAATAALRQGVRVSVLGVGTGQGAPVSLPGGGFLKDSAGNIVVPKMESSKLQTVVRAGGGRFAEIGVDARDLDTLLPATASSDAAQVIDDDGHALRADAWRDRGPWFVLILLPLVLAGFRRGWLGMLALLAVLPSSPAQAWGWNDLWQRSDQQAFAALQEKQPKVAAQLARDPALRGAANYRAEDFAKAAEDFALGGDADADYNRGNALAKAQKYDEALAAYDAALAKQPDHADAKANRDAVAAWLKQQKEKQQHQQQQQNQNQQGGQQGSPGQQEQEQQQQGQQGDQQKDSSSQKKQEQDGAGDKQQDKSGEQQQEGKSEAKDHAGHEAQSKDSAGGKQDDPQAQQQREAAQREAMERALKQAQAGQAQPQSGDAEKDGKKTEALLPQETEQQREQRQSMEQWLQRVPDDPGGLLRRKFQLEYERRQRGGGNGDH